MVFLNQIWTLGGQSQDHPPLLILFSLNCLTVASKASMPVRQYLGAVYTARPQAKIFKILCLKWWHGSNLAMGLHMNQNRNSRVEP